MPNFLTCKCDDTTVYIRKVITTCKQNKLLKKDFYITTCKQNKLLKKDFYIVNP